MTLRALPWFERDGTNAHWNETVVMVAAVASALPVGSCVTATRGPG